MGQLKKLFLLITPALWILTISCSHKVADNLVFVKGGSFTNNKSGYYGKAPVPDFYIARYETTQKEWMEIMGDNPSKFKGEDLPVETVSWYDCIEYCNKRSIKEGRPPYYTIDTVNKDPANTDPLDDQKWTVTINKNSIGYRLPTEVEWEYAADGGQLSRNYAYSGSDSIDEIAWYWKNSGDKYLQGDWSWPVLESNNNRTNPAGRKKPNELGLYDMSGNVREWCWDLEEGHGPDISPGRIWKGGGWIGAGFCCFSSFRAGYQANGKGPDQGFRIAINTLSVSPAFSSSIAK